MNMMNPKMEVVRFDAEDVIATSGGEIKFSVAAGTYNNHAYTAHSCENEFAHRYVWGESSEKNYGTIAFNVDATEVKGGNLFKTRFKDVPDGGAEGNWFYAETPVDSTTEYYYYCPGSSN